MYLLLIPFMLFAGCARTEPRVVLYCAQDQEFAADVLEAFRNQGGPRVAVKFDTEADKSVGFYRELVHEKSRPRCDVFWNNEILSTIRLQRKGLLEPYASPAALPFPASARATDHSWHAFAARARVLIVNTQLVAQDAMPGSLLDLAEARWRGKAVMARPQFGTSATQAACLFAVMGEEKARTYYRGLRENGIRLAPGNKQVAEWVGQGRTPTGEEVAVGVTDTDDAMAEVKAGRAVALVFPDADGFGTLFIPNSVAIIKACPNAAGARRLVDYLLSAEVEEKLARSDSYQIPLNPEVRVDLAPELRTPATVKAMQVDFGRAADLWDEVQKFLVADFARP